MKDKYRYLKVFVLYFQPHQPGSDEPGSSFHCWKRRGELMSLTHKETFCCLTTGAPSSTFFLLLPNTSTRVSNNGLEPMQNLSKSTWSCVFSVRLNVFCVTWVIQTLRACSKLGLVLYCSSGFVACRHS